MKRCPMCKRIYTDQSLGYCIDDGTPLVVDDIASDLESQATALFSEPPPTVQMPPPRPTDYMPGASLPSASPPQPYGWANETPPVWTPPPPPAVRPAQPQQVLAITSFILGMVSMTVGWCCYFGLLTSPVAIVLGIMALVQIKNSPEQYSGKVFAIIGIVTGALYFVLLAVIILIYGLAVLAGGLSG